MQKQYEGTCFTCTHADVTRWDWCMRDDNKWPDEQTCTDYTPDAGVEETR